MKRGYYTYTPYTGYRPYPAAVEAAAANMAERDNMDSEDAAMDNMQRNRPVKGHMPSAAHRPVLPPRDGMATGEMKDEEKSEGMGMNKE